MWSKLMHAHMQWWRWNPRRLGGLRGCRRRWSGKLLRPWQRRCRSSNDPFALLGLVHWSFCPSVVLHIHSFVHKLSKNCQRTQTSAISLALISLHKHYAIKALFIWFGTESITHHSLSLRRYWSSCFAGDGLSDSQEGIQDIDRDRVPNFLDLDSDGARPNMLILKKFPWFFSRS